MKRLSIMLFAAVAVVGCADKGQKQIVISDQNPDNIAYDMSYELATKAVEAENYEDFLLTSEDKYHFRLDDCCWINTAKLRERSYLRYSPD